MKPCCNKKILTNSKVLVTGGAGFIGSNLVESFLKQGNKVICLDNLATGKLKNITEFTSDEYFNFIEGDIRNIEDCRKACHGVDYVFHHAALGSVPRSIKDPLHVAEVNIMGFLNMLIAARNAKVKRFIYASSSSVYGDDDTLPKMEQRTGTPLSPYAVTKKTNELYAENFFRLYGMQIVGLRYFNVFGKKQDPNGAYAAVIPKFISALIKHERPTIYGDGTVYRDFTYVDNVVNANHLAATAELAALTYPPTDPHHRATIYNIACGDSTSIGELFRMIRKELSKVDNKIASIEPVFALQRSGEILHSQADVCKAVTELGYGSAVSVREGLKKTVEFYCQTGL